MVGRVFVFAAIAAMPTLACGSATPAPERAGLRVVVEPVGAIVYIDDRFAGTSRVLSRRPKRLRLGRHHVTITAPDHFPHDVAVDLSSGITT